MNGAGVAWRARALVGCRFRPGGRDPATGLDCVGLVLAATDGLCPPLRVPAAYRPRRTDWSAFEKAARACGLVQTDTAAPGDIVLVRTGPNQPHLLIQLEAGATVHAHAGLRRVVLQPAPLPWPVLRRWAIEGVR